MKKIIKFKLLIINNDYIDQFPKIIVATSSISMLVDDPYSMPTFQGAEQSKHFTKSKQNQVVYKSNT